MKKTWNGFIVKVGRFYYWKFKNPLTGKYTLIAKGAPAPGVNTSSTASPTTSSTSPSDDSSVTSTDGTSSVESAEGGGGSPHTGYESAVFPAVLLLGAGVAAALLAGRRSAKGR